MYGSNDYRNYLAHHGVVGMHWGIRRYQPYSIGYQRIGGKKGKTIGEAREQPSEDRIAKTRELTAYKQKELNKLGEKYDRKIQELGKKAAAIEDEYDKAVRAGATDKQKMDDLTKQYEKIKMEDRTIRGYRAAERQTLLGYSVDQNDIARNRKSEKIVHEAMKGIADDKTALRVSSERRQRIDENAKKSVEYDMKRFSKIGTYKPKELQKRSYYDAETIDAADRKRAREIAENYNVYDSRFVSVAKENGFDTNRGRMLKEYSMYMKNPKWYVDDKKVK